MARAPVTAVLLSALLSLGCLELLVPKHPDVRIFNDDGGWCWFQDERGIVRDGKLLIGSVASGGRDPSRKGSVEVTSVDPSSGTTHVVTLHPGLGLDDHNSPALLALPDGRVLACYSRHGSENRFFHRVLDIDQEEVDAGEEHFFIPSETSRITYSNLFFLAEENAGNGRIYNFFRGLDNTFKPSFAFSDDYGKTWITGGVVVDVPGNFRHRPYVKYTSDGRRSIHLLYTEGHPRDFDNSVYHIVYRDGAWHGSDGSRISSVGEGLTDPRQGTLVFAGSPDSVAWVSDLHLDEKGRPFAVFSVQKNSSDVTSGEEGQDHRYHYAWWNGRCWRQHEIAFAGSRLYPGEDDYTGNTALNPAQLNSVFISTNVSPRSGYRLPGGRYQIFKGITIDGGANWEWTAVSRDSDRDNIRPIVTLPDETGNALLWLRGSYRAYTDYDLEVVGTVPVP